MKRFFLRLWKEESGQDITEYALLLLLICLSAIASMKSIAIAIESAFNQAATNLATT